MTQMNCFLLSGGLFQIYSNPVDHFISYEDITNKALNLYSSTFPNIMTTFNKYHNIIILSEYEQSNIETINQIFINELNLDSRKPMSTLFENIKDNFETIVLKYLDSFIQKFKKVYFNYDNLLYLLIDYNIMKLLGVDISKINFTLNIDFIIHEEKMNPKKCLICDIDLNNLYYYHSIGCFTIYLCHLVKMSLPTQEDKDYINNINENNIKVLDEKGIFFDFSLTFMIQSMNYISYMDNYDAELKDINGNTLSEKIINKTGAYNVLLIYRFFFIEKEIQRVQFFLCNDQIIYTTYVGDHFKNCYYYLKKYYLSRNYSKIDCVLCKLCTTCCLSTYPQLISDLSKVRKEYQRAKTMGAPTQKQYSFYGQVMSPNVPPQTPPIANYNHQLTYPFNTMPQYAYPQPQPQPYFGVPMPYAYPGYPHQNQYPKVPPVGYAYNYANLNRAMTGYPPY